MDKTNALETAVKKDDVEAVKRILEAQTDALSFIRRYHETDHWSLANDCTSYNAYHSLAFLIQYMLQLVNDMGADSETVKNYINEESSTGHAPLHLAAEHGYLECAKILLDEGADPNLKNNKYEINDTPMAIACWENHLEMLKLLIQYGGKLDLKCKHNRTLLHTAAWGNAFQCATFLIEHGADVNARDDTGETPLFNAQAREQINDTRITLLLLEHGAEVNATNKYGQTPLHIAAENNNDAHIRTLLAYGANINAQDDKGKTPLHVSMYCGNIKGYDGCYYYSEDAFEVLLENHPNLELADEDGCTPLLQAARDSESGQMEDLLAAGADIHARDHSDRTVLEVILSKRDIDYYPGGGRNCCEEIYPYLNEDELKLMDAHIALEEEKHGAKKL